VDWAARLQNGYELRGVGVDDEVAMEMVDATQPTVAMESVDATQPTLVTRPAGATEPCAHCGASLAQDQRYCLECGTPRTYLSGMLLERLRAPSAQGQAGQPTQAPTVPPNGVMPFGAAATSPGWQRGNVLTLIAGIGVLLLAMGVGVLIGRSGGSSSAGSAAPQVINVPTPTTGAAGAGSTPTTTPEASSTTPSKSPSAKQKSKGATSSGVGSTPSKPAPPAVLKNLRKGGGGSYEQKSKNLPDVVETG
jgi:hypothetical protein